jgi:carbamoyl-phosphate synthase large subunit
MNVLVLSCGVRNKIVEYLKKSLSGNGIVVAADCSRVSPALYDADKYYIVPRISEDGYLERILEICEAERIAGIFSLIDPELSLLALHEDKLRKAGVRLVGSGYAQCERCLNKWDMFLWMGKKGYDCARCFMELGDFFEAVCKDEIHYPAIIKPILGSASMQVAVAKDRRSAEYLFSQSGGLMIQAYLHGQEIGADCYVDLLSREVVSIFTKKKIVMRAGETDKSVSFKDPRLFALLERFLQENGFLGPVDVDLFDVGGTYYISEVNPRFGGGYPHAYECGADHMRMIVNNLAGIANQKQIGRYDENVYMMKYSEVKLKREDNDW